MTTSASTSAHPPPPLTNIDIIQLAQQNHHSSQPTSTSSLPLPPFLLSESSHQTLLCYVHSCATASPNPSSAVSEYASALISLISLHSSLSSPLLPSPYLHFPLHLPQNPPDRLSLSTIQLFSTHLDVVPVPNLHPILDLITSYIPRITDSEDAQMLILLPKCLELIRTSNAIENAYGYLNSVVDSVIKDEWSKVLLEKMVEITREFSFMNKEKRRDFLGKVFNGMRDVDLQDLPGLVYHLLVLASNGFSKKEVIEGIVMYFGDKIQGNKGSSIV